MLFGSPSTQLTRSLTSTSPCRTCRRARATRQCCANSGKLICVRKDLPVPLPTAPKNFNDIHRRELLRDSRRLRLSNWTFIRRSYAFFTCSHAAQRYPFSFSVFLLFSNPAPFLPSLFPLSLVVPPPPLPPSPLPRPSPAPYASALLLLHRPSASPSDLLIIPVPTQMNLQVGHFCVSWNLKTSQISKLVEPDKISLCGPTIMCLQFHLPELERFRECCNISFPKYMIFFRREIWI